MIFGVVGQDAGARQRYAELAHQHYVAQGARRREAVVSLAEVSRAIGLSRSSLYRHWETAADLSNALVGHLATTSVGWHHHLRLDPGEPVAEAVRRLFADPRAYEGLAIWPAITTDPASSDVRLRCARFERAFVARLARHLELTAPAGVEHPVPWTDLAVAVAALIDGMTTAWAVFRTEPHLGGDPALTDVVVDVIADLVERYPRAVTGPDRPIDVDLGDGNLREPTAGALGLLDRMAAALEAGDLSLTPGDLRIVDVEDLARRTGVTSRFLFQLWPTAADMNADIIREGFDRLWANSRQETLAFTNELARSGGTELTLAERARWTMRSADPSRIPEGSGFASLVALLGDHELAEDTRERVGVWLDESRITVASAMQIVGGRLRPGRTLLDSAVQGIAKQLGMWRILALHDSLLDRQVGFGGEAVPASGAAMVVMAEAIFTSEA